MCFGGRFVANLTSPRQPMWRSLQKSLHSLTPLYELLAVLTLHEALPKRGTLRGLIEKIDVVLIECLD